MDAISLIASWERKVRLSCKKWNRKSGFTACLSRHQTCKMRKIEMKCQSKEKRFWPKIKSIHYRLIQNNFNFTQSFMTVVIKSNIHKRCLSYDSEICILVISPFADISSREDSRSFPYHFIDCFRERSVRVYKFLSARHSRFLLNNFFSWYFWPGSLTMPGRIFWAG